MANVFTIDNSAIPRFRKDSIVDDVDRHGTPIKGKVIDVREGNKVALVSVAPVTVEEHGNG